MRSKLILAATFALPLSVAASTALAQEVATVHPVHISTGTCEAPGEMVVELTALVYADGEYVGHEGATPLAHSDTQVDIPLETILGGDHILEVHKSAEDAETVVACGHIGGVLEDGHLEIGLEEVDGSHHHGVAQFSADEDHTDVEVLMLDSTD